MSHESSQSLPWEGWGTFGQTCGLMAVWVQSMFSFNRRLRVLSNINDMLLELRRFYDQFLVAYHDIFHEGFSYRSSSATSIEKKCHNIRRAVLNFTSQSVSVYKPVTLHIIVYPCGDTIWIILSVLRLFKSTQLLTSLKPVEGT